jgi:hypothetical protein
VATQGNAEDEAHGQDHQDYGKDRIHTGGADFRKVTTVP